MRKILIIIIVGIILIQFFPIDKSNPPADPKMDFLQIKKTPEKTANLIKNSCYDCHSNQSKYPWYSNIQPVAWFLEDHIKEGRKKLNFSTFATYDKKRQVKKLNEAAEQLEKNEMPLDSYVILHSEAKLSASDKKIMIAYFKLMANDIMIINELPMEVEKSDFKLK